MSRPAPSALRATLPVALACGLFAGCAAPRVIPPTTQATPALHGSVLLGPLPVAGARIHLLAVTPPHAVSLLSSGDGKDTLGFYLLSDHDGQVSVPAGSYPCAPGQVILLYALGGDPASPSGLLALTPCAAPTPALAIHEPAGLVTGPSGALWLTGLGSTPLLQLDPSPALEP